ncbi:transcription repressor NadR [Exiguobacterium sp. RIT452]|uniref:transcription repressor NadR n=1 Tax=unclassified Exiguobacterium TaxID=2644629 RepID=UPI000E7549DA|nr:MULTISPECIES: transcription repressor NadR [unclassified Exiguobacterium]RJP00650.1 transcription repressor NadR [Exiguobacterium sp. RIT452]
MERRQSGEERRQGLLRMIQENDRPVTGTQLAKQAGVSRQVIVQDLSLLKAKGYPVVATARGYLLNDPALDGTRRIRKVVCRHGYDQLKAECDAIVDEGVILRDVIVEHPVYGFLTGELMLRSRRDVRALIERLEETQATPLSSLTDGVHIHTLEADNEEALDAAIEALDRLGILVSELDV